MHIVVRILVRHRLHLHEFRAAEPQHVLLLLALRLRDDDQRAIAARVADDREADAGVAGGAFDDQAAGLEEPALLRVEDDVQPGAVLHRAAGIQELGLAEDLAAGPTIARSASSPSAMSPFELRPKRRAGL